MPITQRLRWSAAAWGEQIKQDIRVEESNHDENGQVWSNQDIDPTPPSKRNYRWHNYLLYFVGTGFNNWTGGSSIIGVGLGWQNAVILAFAANILAGLLVSANSKAAARYHIGFPAIARSVYGMWGSSYQVAVRAILACVWYATKVYECASYLQIMMMAIFGRHFTDIPNHVPESIGYTTQQFLCYFLVWVIMVPLLFKRPYQMKWFFTSSCILSFPAIFGLFIYCLVKSNGKISLDSFESSPLSQSEKAWQIIYAFSSTISSGSSYIESIPDMARWAHSPYSPIYITIFTNSVFNPLSSVLGILGTSALQSATGQTIWTPWNIMAYMLEQHTTAAARFGIFLLSVTWFSLSLSQNISSNMIPFGSDVSMLWPRHITMTRGFILVHLLAWAICPWKIYASAQTFLDFMGAYGIFMGPAVSIMLVEYYIVSRGNIFIPSLYVGNKDNEHYWYHGGWNIQAYIAYITAVGLCFVGFISKIDVDVPRVGEDLGNLGWALTFPTGAIVYLVLWVVWPHANAKKVERLKWEELGTRYDSVVVEGEERGDVESLGKDVDVSEKDCN
ncbi:permease for cytosine/purines, uracil, thiamine, allantoin-domain-containing protein [Aspergillus stella-maris]|uniref:permease for cytosine/purines, uracil, thiamine, allantoin-domain-containing protein n=1 Tax=Aspergillus stella-maris TaxID=1810926 RepID=UPI003CCDE2E8